MIALCLGGAPSVWADYEIAKALTAGCETIVIACNDAGARFEGHLDGWATLHPEKFNAWRNERQGNGDYRSFTHAVTPGVEAEVVPHGWYGSSGLYAAQVALEAFGAQGAILCGVPVDAALGHMARLGPWSEAEKFRPGIEQAAAEGAPIRSMSGWSGDVLGRPNCDWIREVAR